MEEISYCIHTRSGSTRPYVDLLVFFFFSSFPGAQWSVGDGDMSTASIPLVNMASINSRKNLGVFQCLLNGSNRIPHRPKFRGQEARAQLFRPIREDIDMELELPGSQIRVAVAVTG